MRGDSTTSPEGLLSTLPVEGLTAFFLRLAGNLGGLGMAGGGRLFYRNTFCRLLRLFGLTNSGEALFFLSATQLRSLAGFFGLTGLFRPTLLGCPAGFLGAAGLCGLLLLGSFPLGFSMPLFRLPAGNLCLFCFTGFLGAAGFGGNAGFFLLAELCNAAFFRSGTGGCGGSLAFPLLLADHGSAGGRIGCGFAGFGHYLGIVDDFGFRHPIVAIPVVVVVPVVEVGAIAVVGVVVVVVAVEVVALLPVPNGQLVFKVGAKKLCQGDTECCEFLAELFEFFLRRFSTFCAALLFQLIAFVQFAL